MNLNSEFSLNEIPTNLVIETKNPAYHPHSEDSLEFHAARLILLLKFAGGNKAKITGRLKLAKLDFFVRYPTYLSKALGNESDISATLKPESPMIRYKYGPWDDKYYNVFALLVAKGFVEILPTKSGDEFSLTRRGQEAANELIGPDFEEIIHRCRLVYNRFKSFSGTQLKNYIYENFPEIVAQSLNSEI